MSYVDRETRIRLNNLSKHVWGAPSAWMKFLNSGIVTPGTEVHPRTRRPKTSERQWYTVETIEALMLDLLKKIQSANTKKV